MRKWAIGIAAVVLAAVLGIAGFVLATALRSEHPVGFQTVAVNDPNGKAFEVGIWYPTDARTWPTLTGLLVQFVATDAPVAGKAHPLIILSHGIAGSLGAHADTALALADAGFVVAAPLHTGDNYKDQSAIGTKDWFPVRARQAHLTISYMLEEWRGHAAIDADKIGMFGFSGGGTTALIVLGAMPDPDAARDHCAKSTEFGCQLWKAKHEMVPDWRDLVHDPRIKAAVIIAPGAGFAFGGYGSVPDDKPVQLWAGEKDESVPTPSNAEVVHHKLPDAEWHLVSNAGHFSFMVPCGPVRFLTSAPICKDPAGFDRAAFHKTFNADVVAFFRDKLAEAPRLVCVNSLIQVCFPNDYLEEFKVGGMAGVFDAYGRPATGGVFSLPESGGHSVFAGHSDVIVEYSRIGLDKACTESACVYYRKQCDLSRRRCIYALMQPIHNGNDGATEAIETGMDLLIGASDDQKFSRMQSDILLKVSALRSVPEYLPLTAFAKTYPMTDRFSSGYGMIECNPWRQTPGCQRPVMEGKSPTDYGMAAPSH